MNIYFTIKMTSVTKNSFILHNFIMFFYDNIFTTCYSTEDITDFSSFYHRQYSEAIKYCFNSFNRIHFCNKYVSAQTFSTHCNAFTAPAITSNYNVFTCYCKVGSTHDTIPYRLACPIAVIE